MDQTDPALCTGLTAGLTCLQKNDGAYSAIAKPKHALQLEELAVKKWGSPEGFQKERDARAAKRLGNATSPKKQGIADKTRLRSLAFALLFSPRFQFIAPLRCGLLLICKYPGATAMFA